MNFNTVYILQLDNYYDRIVRPDLSLFEDGGMRIYLENNTVRFEGINFNPNDGIDTNLLLNIEEWQHGNYLIVLNEENRIISRWFIIEAVRTRGGQYKVTLHRDLITDYWNIIQQSPVLLEKCNIEYDNPLIFNNENMTVNQIKKNEFLLKDNTNCPWIVAYIAKDAQHGLSGTVKVNPELNPEEESGVLHINNTIEEWKEDKLVFYGDYKELKYYIYSEETRMYGNPNTSVTINGLDYGMVDLIGNKEYYNYKSTLRKNPSCTEETFRNAILTAVLNTDLNILNNAAPAFTPQRHTEREIRDYLNLDGKIISDTNGKIFKVKIRQSEETGFTYDISANSSLGIVLTEIVKNSYGRTWSGDRTPAYDYQTPNEHSFKIKTKYNKYEMVLTPLTYMQINYDISRERLVTSDAPYDIIAAPYGELEVTVIENGETTIKTNADISMSTIRAIAKNLDAACYDIQLLPYCPVPGLIYGNKIICTQTTEYSFITKHSDIIQEQQNVGIIFNVPRANFSFDIIKKVEPSRTSIERKINNDCDKWRIASPNYSNYFDFNVEKNGGIDYFNVDCYYKPYTPYIHINPNFNNLYGNDFNDPRGLICGGDFSLTQVKDAWESYQLQNKNFQETFDRQIQNIEVNNKYNRISEIAGAITGTINGAISGATAGGLIGVGQGAAIGGIIGGVSSAVGGIADVAIADKLRSENLDYTKDLFGYQLGNVQAIPLTLSKVSSFNPNNKVFPVLEYYTCTDEEKIAYTYKIAFNGMTRNTIGKIEDVIYNTWEHEIAGVKIKTKNYIKALPIRLHIGEDFHLANAISGELNKGFYYVAGDDEPEYRI